MLTSQVSVWVPIAVGLIGVAGVVAGQVINAWRERRNEEIRWAREKQRDAHQDRLAWREKRLKIAVEFLITLNTWRELAVDAWYENQRDGRPAKRTSSRLHDSVTRMSDQLAEIKLIGSEVMRTAAGEAVDLLLATFARTKETPTDLEEASRQLSATIRALREAFRAELGVTEHPERN
ncbi:MAG TPA: hypothetical protein VGH57_36965 [Amycolatopsis sp.]